MKTLKNTVSYLPESAGVICEFNPFHNGHVRLLRKMREAVGEDGCVICVMSGRFVQRGTPAVADPYIRAQAALSGGANLVLELPFPWSCGPAEDFCTAGISILSRLGVGKIAFGTESGNQSLLAASAAVIRQPSFRTECAEEIKKGQGAASAWTSVLRRRVGITDLPEGYPHANDILAIQYMAAIAEKDPSIQVLTVIREGQAYTDTLLLKDENPPSATALRAVIREAYCDPDTLSTNLKGTMPDASLTVLTEAVESGKAPGLEDALWPYLHGLFRMADAEKMSEIYGLSGGLAYRMIRAANHTATPYAFWNALRSKLYTDAHLRRGMLYAAAGVMASDVKTLPHYTTLLGADVCGCEYLKKLGKLQKSNPNREYIQIVTKPSDSPKCRQTELAQKADALFTLCYPVPQPAGEMMKKSPVIKEKTKSN